MSRFLNHKRFLKLCAGTVGLFFLLHFFMTSSVLAANPNFNTALSITYNVNRNGQTRVMHSIDLTNKTPTLYAKQYGLKVGSPNITNVTVTSNGVGLTPEVVTADAQTSIGITFPDELVGEGKTRRIEVQYLNPDVAVISGKVLEVQVPRLGVPEEYDSYSVTLTTPSEFGLPTRVTPATYETLENGASITTRFTPRNGESVTALYGQQQIFDLKLRYHLENTSTNVGLAQIALPPDTALQKVHIQTLEPRPASLQTDGDGNWIANYTLSPQTSMTVNATVKVLISLQPNPHVPDSSPLPSHTSAQEFWETSAPEIASLSQELQNPRAIYDYVVKTLSYNYAYLENNTPRLGAVNTLANPDQAACQEFTDTFIAIARSAGIPTRRLTGYAYTQNPQLRPLSLDQDILHAWPEYYDAQTSQWQPIDPTWENTTGGVNYFDQFDLNHIVFAINGLSSMTPYPAGSYKSALGTSKDVEVVFGNDFPEVKPSFTVANLATRFSLPGRNQVRLINQTGLAWYNVQLSVVDNQMRRDTTPELPLLPVVLPYQEHILSLPIYSSEVSFRQQSPVQLRLSYIVDNRQVSTSAYAEPKIETISLEPIELSIGPTYFSIITHPYSLVGLGVSSIFITLGAGSLLVFRQRRQRSLRRKS